MPDPQTSADTHTDKARGTAGRQAGRTPILLRSRSRVQSPPRQDPRPARPEPLAGKSGCPGPHLADQLPALVDASRARVAQESGDQVEATAPPPPRPGLHPARELAGSRTPALVQPPTRTTAWCGASPQLWGPRRGGRVLLDEGGGERAESRRLRAGRSREGAGEWVARGRAGTPCWREFQGQEQRSHPACQPSGLNLVLSILRLPPS